MRLVHRRRSTADDAAASDDAARDHESHSSANTVLASDVDVARTTFEQARGLMFRRSVPDDYALVFPFDGVDTRWLHMLFVPVAIDALWLVDGRVQKRKRLAPFVGLGRGRADTIVELSIGATDSVAVGDEIRLVE